MTTLILVITKPMAVGHVYQADSNNVSHLAQIGRQAAFYGAKGWTLQTQLRSSGLVPDAYNCIQSKDLAQ